MFFRIEEMQDDGNKTDLKEGRRNKNSKSTVAFQ